MIIKLFLLQIFLHWSSASRILDSPIIIERPSASHIEWNELILEYNPDSSPIPNITISLKFSFLTSKYNVDDNSLSLVMDMDQVWYDHRLPFHGEKQIPIPDSIRIWQPDTIIHNSVSDVTRKKCLYLNPDGTVHMLERRNAQIICQSADVCPLIIRSFANRGADIIQYRLDKTLESNETTTSSLDLHDRSYYVISHNILLEGKLSDHARYSYPALSTPIDSNRTIS